MSSRLQHRLVAKLGELPTGRLVSLMLALTLGPLALLGYMSTTLATDAVTGEVEARVRSTSSVTASLIDDKFSNLVELIDSYADRPSLIEAIQNDDARSRALVRFHLRNLRQREGIATTFLADPRGMLTYILPETPSIIGDDFSHRDWFRGVTETGRPYVSEVYRTAATGNPLVVTAASPVRDPNSGRTVAIIAAAYDLSALQRFTDELARTEHTILTVTDQRGVIVARSGSEPAKVIAKHEDPAVEAALRGETGVTHDDDVLVAFSPVSPIGFTVTARVPSSVALESVATLRSTVVAIALLLGLVLMAGLSLLVLALRGRRALLDEMQAAKLSAEEANRAKSDFLSRTSHELRTPLNGILGFAQLLEMQDLDRDQRDSVGEIIKGGKHLLSLINEALDIASIESGRMSLSIEAVPIGDVMAESLQLLAPSAADRRVSLLQPEDIPEDIFALADYQRLKQVLLNVGSNAIKYNRRDGTVTITCSATEERVNVVVTDTGAGVAADQLERLFQPFDRLGAEQSGIEGTGLGLALTKNLMEAMGGSISVESEVGVGSRVRLELKATDAPWERVNKDHQVSVRSELQRIAAGNGKTILCIEDDPKDLRVIEAVLGQRPALTLLTAVLGSAGLDLARQRTPDLIVLDVHLPDMSGQALLEGLRSAAATASIPVIVLSGDTSAGKRREILAAGAAVYLTKPIDVELFLNEIDGALAQNAPSSFVGAETEGVEGRTAG